LIAVGSDMGSISCLHCNSVPSECEETLSHCEGDGTLEQVAQRDCGVSVLREIEKPSGHGPD